MIIDVPFVNMKMKLLFTYFRTVDMFTHSEGNLKQCLDELQINCLKFRKQPLYSNTCMFSHHLVYICYIIRAKTFH